MEPKINFQIEPLCSLLSNRPVQTIFLEMGRLNRHFFAEGVGPHPYDKSSAQSLEIFIRLARRALEKPHCNHSVAVELIV